jgi:hypothetical protein
MAVSGMF